jgi:HSP20 family protein
MAETTHAARRNGGGPVRTDGDADYYLPDCDIYETDEAMTFEVEMPGVKPADLSVQFERGVLTLHGRVDKPVERRLLLNEYGVGDYYRRFEVEMEVDAEHISAELRDGVLTLRLPKAQAVRPRKIEVKAG